MNISAYGLRNIMEDTTDLPEGLIESAQNEHDKSILRAYQTSLDLLRVSQKAMATLVEDLEDIEYKNWSLEDE